MTETWLSVTEAARVLGEHRQQLQRMLSSGRIPRRLISPGKPPRLRLEGLAEAVRGAKRRRIDSRPGPPMEPQPLPTAAQVADQQLARLERELAEWRAREAEWVAGYGPFRDWATADFTMELWDALGDGPLEIGDVMTTARQLLLKRLQDLDAIDVQARVRRWRP